MTFHTYTKIKVIGAEENKDIFLNPTDEIVIEEKVDGANFRFMIKDDQLIFGSRTQQLEEDKEHKFQKNFKRCIETIQKAFNELDNDIKQHSQGKIFYGECMVSHTLAYDWDNIPAYLGFDVFDIDSGRFLMNKNKRKLFDSWDLSTVPLIKVCQAKDITEINDSIVPESKYYHPQATNKQAEGIVFKNYDKQIFAKYVRNEFKEKNSATFGGNPKYNKEDDTDNSIIIFKYCTNARIDKIIFKLIDEGHKLDMPLMAILPDKVYEDIIEEEWREITSKKNKYKIDFGKLKKGITKRCLAVLQQMINLNAIK